MTPDIILWRSGCVRRWHNNMEHALRESGDDTGGHQWRVAMLILMLHPLPSSHLLACALTHDTPEIVVGDVPGPMKKGPMGEVVETYERQVAASFALPVPSDKDQQWIGLCDKLDALLWVRDRAPYLLLTPEWQEARKDVLERADALGVRDKVEAL